MRILAALALTTFSVGCSAGSGFDNPRPADPSDPRCFYTDQIRNFRSGDVGQVFVRDRRDEVFEISSAMGCRDLANANQLLITPSPAGIGSARACVGDSVNLTVSATGPQVCSARVARRLTAEEVAALPGARRP